MVTRIHKLAVILALGAATWLMLIGGFYLLLGALSGSRLVNIFQ